MKLFTKTLIFLSALIFALTLTTFAEITFGPSIRVDDGPVDTNAGSSSVAVDTAGNIYAVWYDERNGVVADDIYFAKSIDGGVTFSPNIRLNDPSSQDSIQGAPDIAVDNVGNIYVVWFDMRNGGSDIYFAKSTDGGATFGANVRVDDTGTADQAYPSIAVDVAGNIYIVWADYRNDAYYPDIYFAKSSDGGATFGANVRVDDTGALREVQNTPKIVVDSNGYIYTIWEDFRNGSHSDIYFAKSTDGGATFGANVRVDDTGTATTNQTDCSIAVDNNNKIYVVWEDKRNGNYDIYFAKSTDGGATFGTNVRVDDTGISTSWQCSPEIDLDSTGNIYVVWDDDRSGNYDIYFAQSSDGGATFGTNIRVDDTGASTSWQYITALDVSADGEIYVTWSDKRNGDRDIYFAKGTDSSTGHPPVLSSLGNQTVDEGELLSFIVQAIDADDDNMEFTHPLTNELPSGANFTVVQDIDGLIQGSFTWTPDYTQSGSYPNIPFTVTDGTSPDSENITITVNNVNQAPVLSPIGNKSVLVNTLLSFSLSATDADTEDELIYSYDNSLSGATLDPVTGVFNWTPDSSQIGAHPDIRFTVTDNGSPVLSDSEDITITVSAEDTTAPVTSIDYDDLWHNSDFYINITAADDLSGVKETYYILDSGPLKTLSIDGQPRITIEGEANTLEFWSLDHADNEELPHNLISDIKLDRTKPTVNITSPPPYSASEHNPIEVSGTVLDELSGIDTVTIEVEGGAIYYDVPVNDGVFSQMVDTNDGFNTIKVSAYDLAGNSNQDEIVIFEGWVLNLAVPQDIDVAAFGSGAATSQIILNYLRTGVAADLTQEELYTYGHAFNYTANSALPEMDANAVDYTLGHFDPYDGEDTTGSGDAYTAYNFSIGEFTNTQENFTEYLRDIVHWLAYPVNQGYWRDSDSPAAAQPNTPGAVPANGTYQHWLVVNGAAASEHPCPEARTNPWNTPDFAVYGLWLTDPAVPGIGRNLYVTAEEAQTYLQPLVSADSLNGKYIHVAEPPLEESAANVELAAPLINEETFKVITIAQDLTQVSSEELSPFEQYLETIRRHLYDSALVVDLANDSQNQADALAPLTDQLLAQVFSPSATSPIEIDWSKIIDSALLSDDNFRTAFNLSQLRGFIPVNKGQDNSYYLLPFDKYVQGEFLTTAVIIVDGQTGYFKQAAWLDTPERFVPLSASQATQLVVPFTNSNGNLSQTQSGSCPLSAELIWQPQAGSPFYPYWKVRVTGPRCYVYFYVTQDGRVSQTAPAIEYAQIQPPPSNNTPITPPSTTSPPPPTSPAPQPQPQPTPQPQLPRRR